MYRIWKNLHACICLNKDIMNILINFNCELYIIIYDINIIIYFCTSYVYEHDSYFRFNEENVFLCHPMSISICQFR